MRVDQNSRCYTSASACSNNDAGVQIKLDDQLALTPSGNIICLPSFPLASNIVLELNNQQKKLDFEAMPLLQIACTAIDFIASKRHEVVAHVAKYAETDMLCYRVDPTSDLGASQKQIWQPILDGVALKFDITLFITLDIAPIQQPQSSLLLIKKIINTLDEHYLAPLVVATEAAGSVIVGLALLFNNISLSTAIRASQLDEIHQEQKWGYDEELAQSLAKISRELSIAHQYISLLNEGIALRNF